ARGPHGQIPRYARDDSQTRVARGPHVQIPRARDDSQNEMPVVTYGIQARTAKDPLCTGCASPNRSRVAESHESRPALITNSPPTDARLVFASCRGSTQTCRVLSVLGHQAIP